MPQTCRHQVFPRLISLCLAGLCVAAAVCGLERVVPAQGAEPAARAQRTARTSKSSTNTKSAEQAGSKAAAAKPGHDKAAKSPVAKSAKPQPGASAAAEPEIPPEVPAVIPETIYSTGYKGEGTALVQFINTAIRAGWKDNNVAPSPVADDAEWLRRVHLDLTGRIPDLETTEEFQADKAPDKRARMIDDLLEDPAYVRNLTTIWTNLLIGRATRGRDRLNRPGLEKFLRMSFAKDRPWNEIVYDLVAAEGRYDENGAVNFLLAHLNDGAVPATAITARLFLGTQVQCTQCHNHPFNDWKQDQFWEFNSFFKQTASQEHRKYDERTGRMVIDYVELTSKDFEGPVFYEQRNAVMKVAFPKYNGTEVEPGVSTNRRKELARLMTANNPQLALAMVNRVWGHFCGYGFTKPVDDMGPHNAPSHPALLERLSAEFIASHYNLKQLTRWICNSEAYNLTSRFNAQNSRDNPPAGMTPLFSRMYLKSLSAEQAYDSLIVATNAHKTGKSNWEQAEKQRQQWLQQFVVTFGTDENDEVTTFEGTIPQALMLMNGELIEQAISNASGSLLHTILTEKSGGDAAKVRKLYLATLGRVPTKKEFSTAQKVLGKAASGIEAYQDLFWALLNSNEFIFNH